MGVVSFLECVEVRVIQGCKGWVGFMRLDRGVDDWTGCLCPHVHYRRMGHIWSMSRVFHVIVVVVVWDVIVVELVVSENGR